MLQEYPRQFPQVRLSILDRSQREVVGLVRSRDVDFGLVLESWAPPDLAVLRWQEVEMVLMTPPGHPLTLLSRVTLADIAPYPLILPPRGQRSPGRQTLEALFQKQGLPYRVVMESSNVELSSLYVELGLGLSFATIVKGLPFGPGAVPGLHPPGPLRAPGLYRRDLKEGQDPERPPPGLSGPVAVAVTSGGRRGPWPPKLIDLELAAGMESLGGGPTGPGSTGFQPVGTPSPLASISFGRAKA